MHTTCLTILALEVGTLRRQNHSFMTQSITESGLNVVTNEKGVLILSNSQGQEYYGDHSAW